MTKPQIIYNMPEDEYHALERFSSSGIKKLLISSQDFWKSSWMNKDREEEKKKCFNEGTAYHKRILEGKKAFKEVYSPEFDAADHPDALVDMNQMKAILEKHSVKAKRSKSDTMELINLYHPELESLDDLKDEHAQLHDLNKAGKEKIYMSQKLIDEIEAAAHRIETKPELAKHFAGGKSEVTFLWTDAETGISMKARFDKLRDRAFTDLKTFSNARDSEVMHVLTTQIANYKYHVQMAVYREAMKQCLDVDDAEAVLFFQQTGGINNAIPLTFKSTLLLAVKGQDMMRAGLNKFRDMGNKYGTNEWFDDFSEEELTDERFPLYVLD